jgi:hypothetical protein
LQWLAEIISNRFGRWAVFHYYQIPFLDLVSQEEVTNIQGTSSFA